MARTPEQRLRDARACLLGASARLATLRCLGSLNSNDRDLLDEAERAVHRAIDLVWEAQTYASETAEFVR